MQKWFKSIFILFLSSQCFAQAWVRQQSGLKSELRAVAFFDSLHGFAAGNECVKTSDGGKHWALVPEVQNCNDLIIDEHGILWFAKHDSLGFSVDSGKSFTIRRFPSSNHLASHSTLLSGSADLSYVSNTKDSGSTWQLANIHTTIEQLSQNFGSAIAYSSNFTGLIVGDECQWHDVTPSLDKFEALILISFDSGKTWGSPGPPPESLPKFLKTEQAIDSVNFIIAGDSSYIARVSPSSVGCYWCIGELKPLRHRPLINDTIFESVHFFTLARGFVIGTNGTILYTENGGNFWSIIPSPDTTALLKITFVDSTNGWIVGSNGVILHTDNGGWVGGTSDVKENEKNPSEGYTLTYSPNEDEWILHSQNQFISIPEVRIYSLLGIQVSENMQCNEISDRMYSLPRTKLPCGFYMARFQSDNKSLVLPLIQR